MPVGARRTQSLPSKYMIPSESMGEYEGPNRRRSAPAKPTHLYPLNEEGTYGRPPAGPKPPSPIFKRERKPKIYSSYAVDNKCCLHAKKIEKIDDQRKKEQEEARSRRRRSMSGRGSRNVSASPSRASSRAGSEARENIPSENMGEYENGGNRNRRRSATNTNSSQRSSKSPEPLARTEANIRKKSGEYGRKMTPNTTTGYSNTSASSYKFSAVREETESDYLYQENRKSSGYSKYANDGGLSNGIGSMSLNGLREPQIDSWDSMGILGLSSKMWKESAKKQENFMSTTSAFAGREENYNSYIM